MLRKAVPVLALLACAACASDVPTAIEHEATAHPLASRGDLGPTILAQLAEVRQVTAPYHNLDAAIAAGYTVWSPDPFAPNATCPSSSEGNMGYHLVNPSLRGSAANPAAGDAVLDPLRPEMLLYEKLPNGELHLVGVEYIVFQAAWQRVHGANAPAPELFGQTVPLANHTFPGGTGNIPHYELHVWLFTPNPLGIFSHYNPTVTC
jgi:hypothetical protein